MPKINMFIVCDSVNNIPVNDNGSVMQLISPRVALRPPIIPGAYSFGVAVGVRGIDLKVPTRVRYTITDPEDKIIFDTGDTELPPAPAPDSMPFDYQGFLITTDVRNVVVNADGLYKFNLFINEEQLEPQEVPIFKRAEQ